MRYGGLCSLHKKYHCTALLDWVKIRLFLAFSGCVKAVPLQARKGPEGSRKLRFPDFVTTAQGGGRLSALRTGRLYSRKYSWYSFLLEAKSTPGPWCDRKNFMSIKNPVTLAGIKPATFRFVAQHLNHCATAVLSMALYSNMCRRCVPKNRRLRTESVKRVICGPNNVACAPQLSRFWPFKIESEINALFMHSKIQELKIIIQSTKLQHTYVET